MQASLDEVVLGLAGRLGEEPVVLVTALHGLVPVDAVVVAAATAGVVVAAVDVVALSVAVVVVWGADSTTASSVSLLRWGGPFPSCLPGDCEARTRWEISCSARTGNLTMLAITL